MLFNFVWRAAFIDRFFVLLVLDKAICPFLVKHFDLPLFHPTCDKSLDALLNAQIDLLVTIWVSVGKLFDFMPLSSQILCQRNCGQEDFSD